MLQFAVKLVSLQFQLLDLILLRCDIALQILDFVIKHEFEFLKLLSLFLKLEDLVLAFGDLVVFLGD